MDHVALLHGVNVGGVKVVMARLRELASELGWGAPATYIASGNLVFCAEGTAGDLAGALQTALHRDYGRQITVTVLPAAAMRAALAACPFTPEAGKHVHAFFLGQPTTCDMAVYHSLRRPTEELVLHDRIAWLHAPEGVGRSDLAQKIDRVLGRVPMTARNLNTVRALTEMLDARQGR